MILLFNHLPVTLQGKINKLVEKAIQTYGSDFYDVEGSRWKGDELTVESLFPDWILKAAKNDSGNSIVVSLIKNYLRWLMSPERGYGANPNWSAIRDPYAMNPIFYQGLAEYYFPEADFGSEPLSNILPNIVRFSTKIDDNYLSSKGTPEAIKYALMCLFNIEPNSISVVYTAPGILTITSTINSSYRSFINTYIVPAGIIVIYN
jgi:hypothetical protein